MFLILENMETSEVPINNRLFKLKLSKCGCRPLDTFRALMARNYFHNNAKTFYFLLQ